MALACFLWWMSHKERVWTLCWVFERSPSFFSKVAEEKEVMFNRFQLYKPKRLHEFGQRNWEPSVMTLVTRASNGYLSYTHVQCKTNSSSHDFCYWTRFPLPVLLKGRRGTDVNKMAETDDKKTKQKLEKLVAVVSLDALLEVTKAWFPYRRICRVCRTKKIHRTDRIHSISYKKLYLSFLLYWAFVREVSIKL